MKKITFFFLITLFLFSCQKEEETTHELRYDKDNFSAPALPAGTFDAALRFPNNILDNYIDWELREVDFYIQDKPVGCEVLIFDGGTATSPGSLIYSKDILSEVAANSWNTHIMSTPIKIKNEDLWIAIRVVHNSEIRSIGCDEGPARTNGDWMLGEGETEWKTYRTLSNSQVNINWNIRGQIFKN